MKNLILLTILIFIVQLSHAQIGINTNTPDPSAALDVNSSDKGLLIPRVETSSVSSPATGLMVFQPSDNGFYFYNGTTWQILGSVVQSELADADGDTKIQVEETTDDDIIRLRIKGQQKMKIVSDSIGRTRMEWSNNSNNIANGFNALQNNTTGNDNIANGSIALENNTTGSNNIANGYATLAENTAGNNNIANGRLALNKNTTGHNNIANGYGALNKNIIGENNIANGNNALTNNITGNDNIAHGYRALYSNTYGVDNIANGKNSLYNNTDGSSNIAMGFEALYNNTSGSSNVALGYWSLRENTEGIYNIALGPQAMYSNTDGQNNIALGLSSLYHNTNGVRNIALGFETLKSNTTGISNIALGYQALNENQTGNHNIAIGMEAGKFSKGSNNLFLGRDAGAFNVSGNKNVFIGYQAGHFEVGSNKLYIDNSTTAKPLVYGDFDTNLFWISGNVGIGNVADDRTLASGYKLSVKGKLMAEEVRVLLEADWPDYVFEDNYALTPIPELEKQIDDLGHLPGIPSAAEIETNGQDLGEINRLQIEKIEELTLYIIELEKRIRLIENKHQNK